jgi:hypothetical protein
MGNYNYAIRRYNRHVKAMRRLREDRAEARRLRPRPARLRLRLLPARGQGDERGDVLPLR